MCPIIRGTCHASDNPNHYTLYGNSQSNVMECKITLADHILGTVSKKDCIMVSGSSADNEGDTFILDFGSSGYTIKDFKTGKDPDKIEIRAKNATISPDPDAFIGSEPVLAIKEVGIFGTGKNAVEVNIEGHSLSEIAGWVDKAKSGSTKDENGNSIPIVINK